MPESCDKDQEEQDNASYCSLIEAAGCIDRYFKDHPLSSDPEAFH